MGTELYIDNRITVEITRATTSEGVNATAIADETTRATAAEGVNATAIADETTRATAAEGVNATAIADETTRATAAEGVNATAIADETTRATAAEGVNATAISTHISNDSDLDANNELQTLSINGDTLFISSGNSIVIPGLSLINSLIVQGCTDSTACNYNSAANTDDNSCILPDGCTDATALNYNSSATCDDGSCASVVGDNYQGGKIFWLDGNGGGLIAAPSDQSSGAQWGCYGTVISGADGTAIGTGNQNTIDIEAGCTTSGTAADICANLTLGGYSDWFLPSIDELNKMYLNIGQGNALGLGNIGGFAYTNYWSSTEDDSGNAWKQVFSSGIQYSFNKDFNYIVRAVRAF